MSLELSIVLRTSIVLACAASIAMVFGRRCSAAGRHRIWHLSIWAALAVPAISFLAPKVDVPILPAPQVMEHAPGFPDISGDITILSGGSSPASLPAVQWAAPANVRSVETPGLTWGQLLLALWGLGSLIVMARIVLGLREVQLLRRRSIIVWNQVWGTQLRDLQDKLGVATPVQLRCTDQQIPPMTWGVFRPIILIPTASWGWTEERRQLVLAHELSHVKRNDGRTQIVVQLACSLYWFNPLVWYAARRIRIERERACDDLVLSLGAEADAYADHLLQIARTLNSGLSFATVSMAHRAQLETRLRAILDPFTRRRALGRAGSAAVLAAVAALTATTGVLQLTALTPMIRTAPVPVPPLSPIPATQPEVQNTSSSQLAGSASVSGSVSKIGSGEALPGTRVALQKYPGGGEAAYSTVTASDGSFVFPDVQPGEYRVIATREDGMLPAEYKQKSPTVRGVPILVHLADAVRDIRLAMASPGSISGRVFDHDGEPVGNAQVQALKVTYRRGQRVLSIAESVQTNDIGEYRLFWLAPAQYYITAKPIDTGQRSASMYIRPPSERGWHDETSAPVITRHVLGNGEIQEEIHPLSFYPGTPDLNAARPLALNPADSLSRMDITISAPITARHIRGTVIDGSTGQPASGASLRAIPRDGNPSVVIPNATSDGRGAFDIAGVAPGSYYLFVTAARSNADPGMPSGAAGRLAIEVGGEDLKNVGITVPLPFEIRGRLVVDGKTDPDFDITRLKVSLSRDPDIVGMPFAQPITRAGAPDPNATQTDGGFALAGIGPGDYRITVTYTGFTGNAPSIGLRPGTYLKSIRLGNADILNGGLHLDARPETLLEITIGMTAAEVGGAVVTDKSEAVPSALVVLVPDPALRRRDDLYKTTGTGPSGQFTIRNIPPGDYTLFAFEGIESGSWFDPEFLKTFETRGTRVHVTETTMENRQLVVIDAQR